MNEESGEQTPPEDDIAVPIGSHMEPMPSEAEFEFDAATAENLRRRLDEFDEMRTRAYVESRSVHLGVPRGR
jgi:hypothetical protein